MIGKERDPAGPSQVVGWWIALSSYAVVVLIGSVVPSGSRVSFDHLDKVAHLCEYLLFAWLVVQTIRTSRAQEPGYAVLAWVYASSYGLLMELLQALIPWRSADLADAVANTIGAAVGAWLGQKTRRAA